MKKKCVEIRKKYLSLKFFLHDCYSIMISRNNTHGLKLDMGHLFLFVLLHTTTVLKNLGNNWLSHWYYRLQLVSK